MHTAATHARDLVLERFPEAIGAFLAGSFATGTARPTSDLDIVVLLPTPWEHVSYVETAMADAQLVEFFVYGIDGLAQWQARNRAARQAGMDRRLADAIALLGTSLEPELMTRARQVLQTGPAPLSDDERREPRYHLSSLLDDLVDAVDAGAWAEATAVGTTAWRSASELVLLDQRRWLGSGKWLARELATLYDDHGLLRWASAPRPDHRMLPTVLRAVLDASGGYLQAGMLRGDRPDFPETASRLGP